MNAKSVRFVGSAVIVCVLGVVASSCGPKPSPELAIPGLDLKIWVADETNGRGKLAKWKIIKDDSAPSKSPVIAITENKNKGQTYNLLIAQDRKYNHVEMEIKVKAIRGKEDRGGGLIWRVQDAKNYYLARWNPLEENLRLYVVQDGRRRQLASVDVTVDPTSWHEIEIEQEEAQIEVDFNGHTAIEFEDETFLEAGMVGLWTKADAASAFNEFYIETTDD
ncbi:MAG: family 16 glycoside hydrolase [Planctomycetota bacterium]|jgi:hypothetical protein